MREIKFRAWLDYGDGRGEMLPNVQNHINGEWAFGHIVLGNVKNVSAPMQFTGLKDKNGVEIYEGDVLAAGEVPPREVYFDNGSFRLRDNGSNQADQSIVAFTASRMIVFGNIHQNPELLN